MLNIKRTLLISLLLLPKLSFAAGEVLTVVQDINFGETVPSSGSCEMDVITGEITPANLCVSDGVLGIYTITATANTNIEIKAISTVGDVNGFILEPTIRLTNNLGDEATNLNPDTYIDFSTGSDGLITVYMAGTLTFPGGSASGSSQSLSAELEFTEDP
ncbi:hypothetical protein GCM10008107_10270 [Psychrosphaera saromensis]|uniref:DUF4402 domain-containing protein n=1 Tax=Psychrosphaera saromensis TaxID=716813 RepID=A0A2S7UUS8_9GAMM|nr:hypothetical protein [Psychrosphaera saromensis]PQJ53693.1 hypothetical protein BTO11_08455 [Psychrosphaera saromensis]GHB63118.1 hypothetical protein GCM10008107_10270 [Psychrosphaera saromensis]GLQ15530.1 hypothetical protein GCM10007917_29850 [Psychrosphaera saromensis]